jgi:hypothetical protein
MKTKINSLKGKYIINMMMIVFFGMLVYTSFSGEEGKRQRPDRNSLYGYLDTQEQFMQNEVTESGRFIPGMDGAENKGSGDNDLHDFAGLVWVGLMLIHIFQHLNWYKKILSPRHILNNKLLTFTLIIFFFLALSGINLSFEIIPRQVFNFREFHEFLGRICIGLILIHIIQRWKWIVMTTKKLTGNNTFAVSKIRT